jgi:hypothetical protein
MIPFSPNLTVVPLGSPAVIIDPNGNRWGITLGAIITFNGSKDPTTANVTQIALVNNVIWQQNMYGLWWQSPTLSPSKWLEPGVPTSPILPYISADEQ